MIETGKGYALARSLVLLTIAAALLSGCQTDGNSPGPFASLSTPANQAKPAEPAKPVEAAKPPDPPKAEPPMTKSRAAMECWMKTEKGSAGADLDKRADVVNKCIDDKLKSAAAAPKT
jgi:hypothetical protein